MNDRSCKRRHGLNATRGDMLMVSVVFFNSSNFFTLSLKDSASLDFSASLRYSAPRFIPMVWEPPPVNWVKASKSLMVPFVIQVVRVS